MKSKKLLIIMPCVIIVAIIGISIWFNAPSSIINISPSEVSNIKIFNGTTGKSITITDANEISHIIDNLNTVSLKKDKVSLGYMGYVFRITIYKANGKEYKEFIINSKNTIRKDPFFYRDNFASIDFDYIQQLFN